MALKLNDTLYTYHILQYVTKYLSVIYFNVFKIGDIIKIHFKRLSPTDRKIMRLFLKFLQMSSKYVYQMYPKASNNLIAFKIYLRELGHRQTDRYAE